MKIHKIDMRGAIGSFILLKVSQVFRTLQPGETLEILWNEPVPRDDLFKVLPALSFQVIGMETLQNSPGERKVVLKKTVPV